MNRKTFVPAALGLVTLAGCVAPASLDRSDVTIPMQPRNSP